MNHVHTVKVGELWRLYVIMYLFSYSTYITQPTWFIHRHTHTHTHSYIYAPVNNRAAETWGRKTTFTRTAIFQVFFLFLLSTISQAGFYSLAFTLMLTILVDIHHITSSTTLISHSKWEMFLFYGLIVHTDWLNE